MRTLLTLVCAGLTAALLLLELVQLPRPLETPAGWGVAGKMLPGIGMPGARRS